MKSEYYVSNTGELCLTLKEEGSTAYVYVVEGIGEYENKEIMFYGNEKTNRSKNSY